MSSSSIYNHRPMQPAPARSIPATNGSHSHSTFSLVDTLDTIKREYETLQTEVNEMRHQRNDLESKLDTQTVELNNIRRALFDLEAKHIRIREHYEDELSRLQREGHVRDSRDLPSSSLGAPLRSPRPLMRQTSTTLAPYQPLREKTPNGHGELRGPLGRSQEEDYVRRERDQERLTDPRDPKRYRRGREYRDSRPPSTPNAETPLQERPPSTGLGPSFPSAARKKNLNPKVVEAIEDLVHGLQRAPHDYRKELGEWYAIYNPKVKKSVDINLAQTFYHPSVVCCVQFSSDGKFLATGCNRTTQIFEVHSGIKLCVLVDDRASPSEDLYIRSVRFSPDGKLLATGAEDSRIRVWDIAKRRIIHTFEGHQSEIYSLDFSRDGKYIVSGSGDRTLRIWNLHTQSCKIIMVGDSDTLGEESGVTSVAISGDGTMVVAGSLDKMVRIWDIHSGKLLEKLRGHEDSVYSVAFTPDGKGVISGSLDQTLKFWDVSAVVQKATTVGSQPSTPTAKDDASEKPISASLTCMGHRDFVLSTKFTTDSRWIVSGSKDRTVHFWDARTAELQFMLQGHKNSGTSASDSLKASELHRVVLSGSTNPPFSLVISLDIHPFGGMMATGSGDSTTRLWTYSAM